CGARGIVKCFRRNSEGYHPQRKRQHSQRENSRVLARLGDSRIVRDSHVARAGYVGWTGSWSLEVIALNDIPILRPRERPRQHFWWPTWLEDGSPVGTPNFPVSAVASGDRNFHSSKFAGAP